MAEQENKDIEPGTAGKEVNLETPLGKVNLKGYHFGNFLQFAAIVLLAFMCFMIWEQRQAAALSTSTTVAAVKAEHETINSTVKAQTAAIERQTEAQEVTTYILTLSQAQRERLNVQMPESLRRRVIGRDR